MRLRPGIPASLLLQTILITDLLNTCFAYEQDVHFCPRPLKIMEPLSTQMVEESLQVSHSLWLVNFLGLTFITSGMG